MGKFTKLIKNPKLFFIDAIKKRVEPKKSEPKKSEPKKSEPKKSESKKSEPKKSEPTFETYQLNLFYPYSILLHTGEGENGITHMNLWIPIFQKAEVDFVVLVRNYEVFKYLKENYENVPIIMAKSDKEVDKILKMMKSLKVCFYPSNTGNNIHILKYSDIKHIFIGHGDSDKMASAHKYFRVYDENWVAGEAHIDRFNNAGLDHTGIKHVKVGRPNLKETLLLTQSHWKERFDGKINLLYLSTWEGFFIDQEYTSVEIIKIFFENIHNLISDINIKIKLHPGLGRRKKELIDYDNKIIESWNDKYYNLFKQFQDMLSYNFKILKKYPQDLKLENIKFFEFKATLQVYSKDTPVEELIKNSNVFICDISAVISEALAGNGPIFVYVPKDKPIKILQSNMKFEDYTYVFSSIEELEKKFFEVVIKGNDYLEKNRKKAMEYILGKKETLEDRFIQNLQKIERGISYDI